MFKISCKCYATWFGPQYETKKRFQHSSFEFLQKEGGEREEILTKFVLQMCILEICLQYESENVSNEAVLSFCRKRGRDGRKF